MKLVEIQGTIFVKRWWNLYTVSLVDGKIVLVKAKKWRGK